MSIKDLIGEISKEAFEVTSSGRALVFVEYSGHVSSLHIEAYPAGTEFKSGVPRLYIFRLSTYVDTDTCIEKLKDMLIAIQDLK